MSKIHIALVGGQNSPVYLGIMGTRPNRVVLITSEQTRKSVDTIKSVLPSPLPIETIMLSPIDPVKIHQVASDLAEKYKNDEAWLNISGGLKSWSHIFGYIFQSLPNAHVIYVDQNNTIWDYKDNSKLVQAPFDMKTRFILNNNPLINYTPFLDYTEDDFSTVKTILDARTFDVSIFEQLVNPIKKGDAAKLNAKEGTFDAGLCDSYVQWQKAKNNQLGFVNLLITKKNGMRKEFRVESKYAPQLMFHTHWFEYYVAEILSHWELANEICLNAKFVAKNNAPKNEVDVIVSTGVKVLFVECKLQIVSPTDIDKFRSVVRNYGGTGAKGIFITDQPINDICKQKCEENSLLHFSLHDKGAGAAKQLYKYLDSNIETINAK